jgi:hypothetical protein
MKCGIKSASPYQAAPSLDARPIGRPRKPTQARDKGCTVIALCRVGVAERVMHRADQRRTERQHARAVARGALREQHHRVAAEQAPGDFPGRGAGLLPSLAFDEDRALRFGEPAEHRPARHFALGDELHRPAR